MSDLELRTATLRGDLSDEGIFEAVACTYGREDQHGTVWLPGCFTASLQRGLPEVRWAHRTREGRVGEVIDYRDLDDRLEVIGKLDQPEKASGKRQSFIRRAWAGLKARAIEEFSIGARTERANPLWTEIRSGVPHFRRADLFEVSLVLEGSVPDTALLAFRAANVDHHDGATARRLAAVLGLDLDTREVADHGQVLAAADQALQAITERR